MWRVVCSRHSVPLTGERYTARSRGWGERFFGDVGCCGWPQRRARGDGAGGKRPRGFIVDDFRGRFDKGTTIGDFGEHGGVVRMVFEGSGI